MRRFANIFLILFLCDGLVSLADELFLFFTADALPFGMRSLFAWPVMAASVPLYVCLGIDRRLPKSIFLPQLMLIFWSMFDLWPLPVMFHRSAYMMPAVLAQILLGVAPLVVLKRKTGRTGLLPPDLFSAPFFGL